MAQNDTTKAETDFRTLLSWIQAGETVDSIADEPYRWTRGGYTASHMSRSPAGEFLALQGNGMIAYLRPDRSGFGHMRRIDLRAGTTQDTLELAVSSCLRTI